MATERLGQKLHRASLFGLYRHGNVAVADDKKDDKEDGNVGPSWK